MDRGIRITLESAGAELFGKLQGLDGITHLHMPDNYTVEIDFRQDSYTAFDLVRLVDQYAQIQDFQMKEPSIERVIKKIVTGHGAVEAEVHEKR